MFAPSTKAVSSICQEIADTAGASGDSATTTRAGRSLNAAIKHFTDRYKWNFLLAEAVPSGVLAPFGVTGSVSATGVSAVTVTNGGGHGVSVDDFLTGPLFPAGTRVSATAASSISFAVPPGLTAWSTSGVISATALRDSYDLPADFKTPYSVRLLVAGRALRPAPRRFYDRGTLSEATASTPEAYDVFRVWEKGKIRLLPPPAGADVMQLRYYRRVTVPSATAATGVLDFPQDYDDYLISWAKWHFLTDRGEARLPQAGVWLSLAQEGLKTMLQDQTTQPDQDLGFYPGTIHWPWGPNSTYPWLYGDAW